MNEDQNTEAVKSEEVGKVDTQTTEKTEGTVEMISKEEAQKMADAIVAKKLAKMPTKEELQKYNEYKESQKTEADKQTEKELKLTKLEQETINLKNENILLKKGVKVDDVDYVLFKVSKMEGEFEANLNEYLKENVKYTKEEEKETTGVAVNRNNTQKESGVSAILKAKHPELFN